MAILIARYHEDGSKDKRSIAVQPGTRVHLPTFCAGEAAGVTVGSAAYRLVCVIFHLGSTVHSGHHQVATGIPGGVDSEEGWRFLICNDNKLPHEAGPRDPRIIATNSYL